MKFGTKPFNTNKWVVKASFKPTLIDLREATREKAATKPQDDKQDTRSSPQKKGQDIHRSFKDKIKKGKRDGMRGEMLEKIKDKFGCEFIEADVSISGYAVKRKTQVDFWSGRMDAVAIRRQKNVLQVFVVEWKTTDKPKVQIKTDWWKNAGSFKQPLYQCLVYRELLRAHLKHNGVDAKVGIILVPSHQSYPEIIYPGLCVDFLRMDKELLLDRLKDFQWFAVLDKSINIHSCVVALASRRTTTRFRDDHEKSTARNNEIKLPCIFFKVSFDPAVYVDICTNNLKDDTRLKDILNDNAPVADLLQLLDLPFLKVEGIKKEEKTNEELEGVSKKCLRHVVMTAKFSVLNKPENNQHHVTVSLFSSFFLLWRTKPFRSRRKSLPV